MIFLVQFGIHKHLLIFNKIFKKITHAYLFQITLEIMWLPIRINWNRYICIFRKQYILSVILPYINQIDIERAEAGSILKF